MADEHDEKYSSRLGPTRYENRLKAKERKKELAQRLLSVDKRPRAPAKLASTQSNSPPAEAVSHQPAAEHRAESPFSKARYGNAQVPLLDRGAPETPLYPEPWLARLVDNALQAANARDTRLFLAWPGTIGSVALIHALATLERFAVGDKRGLRALVFPTKRTSYAALNQLLISREHLIGWSQRYFTVTDLPGAEKPIEGRDDDNKDMLIQAVRSAQNVNSEIPSPCIAEVMPHFDRNLETGGWGDYEEKFLRRTKRTLQRSYRRNLSERFERLGQPETAPDALFGVSHRAAANEWKAALAGRALQSDYDRPELVLIDLTKSIRGTTDRNLIRLTPTVIEEIRQRWKHQPGILVVTDDPKTYYTLRKQLPEKSGSVTSEALIALDEEYGLSSTPKPVDWVPPAVTNKHYHVEIVDAEMAAAATRFWTIAQDFPDESEAQRAVRSASAFLLRLANLPGGYLDYIRWLEDSAFADSIRADMTWNGHEARLLGLIERGAFESKSDAVRRAIKQGLTLVEAYSEQTQIARRIAKELETCITKPKAEVTVVLRSNTDVNVAIRFLTRDPGFPGGARFEDVADRVHFIIHRELDKVLSSATPPTKLVFVGVPDETLKLLLTSEQVPANSVVLLDYQRANGVLAGLRALKWEDAYKPYRGRISEFGDEIERRINSIPGAIDVEKLNAVRVPRLSLSAAASEASRRAEGPAGVYRLQISDDSRVMVGHRVYVYDPDESETFHSKNIEDVKEGDLVFVMSDELKDMFEVELIEAGHKIPRGSSFGEMLRNYHVDVLNNSQRLFGELKPRAMARKIQERMEEVRPGVDCSLTRLVYWLDVQDSQSVQAEDIKPHSTWKKADFETFCQALEIPENLIAVYWLMVTNQRTALQQAGRELAERYAHVLFREEAAEAHFKLSRETIAKLQHEAVRNTYRVVKVIPPVTKDVKDDKH